MQGQSNNPSMFRRRLDGFVYGNKKSIEETIRIFDAFAVRSEDKPRKINIILSWSYRYKS